MDEEDDRSIRVRQIVRVLVWLVIAGLLLLFAAVNSQELEVDWIWGESNMPLWVVILGSALAGAIIGYIARWRRR